MEILNLKLLPKSKKAKLKQLTTPRLNSFTTKRSLSSIPFHVKPPKRPKATLHDQVFLIFVGLSFFNFCKINAIFHEISDWRAEKKLNKETFGVAGNRGYNRGYRGYNRGYNNRGYYNNRQVDFSLLQK